MLSEGRVTQVRTARATQGFYTRFYTAGWDWLVRSGTDWHVECAKPHLRGTGRHRTGRESSLTIRLITRRSQVQILPPPPSKVPGQRPFSRDRGGPLSCPDTQISTVFSTVRRVTANAGLAQGGTDRDLDPSPGRLPSGRIGPADGAPGPLGVDLRVRGAYRGPRSASVPSDIAGTSASSPARDAQDRRPSQGCRRSS